MKIKKIQKLSSGKYKIKLENNDTITTYDDIILDEKILLNKDIDEEKFKRIEMKNSFYTLYSKVIKFISKKIRSEKEIDEYIKKIDADKYSDKIKDKLKEQSLINDENYLKAYIYDRVILSTDGPYKIINYLNQQGINNELVNEEINKYEKEFDEKLEKLVIKKINSNKNKSKTFLKQKLTYYFIDLGYSKKKIIEYFDRNYSEDNSIIEKEYNKLIKKYGPKYEGDELYYFIKNKLYSKGFKIEDIEKIRK